MVLRRILVIALVLSLAVILSGCNLFGWTSEKSAKSLIDEGRQLMRDGEYAAAEAKFAQAKEKDPHSSDARYYHAKAVMHGSGFNPLDLADIVANSPDSAGQSLPFFGPEWPNDRANNLYRTARIVYSDLAPIYYGFSRGDIGREDIDFDLAIVATIRGLLLFRDTNSDGLITSTDHWFSIGGQDNVDRDGYTINNFAEYVAGNASVASKDGQQLVAAEPVPSALIVAFNSLVDNIALVIAEAYSFIVTIATEEYGLDIEEVQDLLEQLILTAHIYRIDPVEDNDDDGAVDEEIINGIDDDGDGFYDEDSNGTYELLIAHGAQ